MMVARIPENRVLLFDRLLAVNFKSQEYCIVIIPRNDFRILLYFVRLWHFLICCF